MSSSNRVLLYKTDRYHQTVGEAFSIPLKDIAVTSSGIILRTLQITKKASGEPVIGINFGLRKGALENVSHAITSPMPI